MKHYVVTRTFGATAAEREVYRGDDGETAHALARSGATRSKVMGEPFMVMPPTGPLTVYRRGPAGIERNDY